MKYDARSRFDRMRRGSRQGVSSVGFSSTASGALDRPELFEIGALSWPADGVVLNRQHERGAPVMRVLPIVDGDELRIDQQLPDTTAGRDAATEIRQGLMRGLSLSFQAKRQSFSGGVRRIESAIMTRIGLVDSPSYDAPVEIRQRREGRRRVWL